MPTTKKTREKRPLPQTKEVLPLDLNYLKEGWPRPFVYRGEISSFSQGMYSPYHLANLDCHDQGPSGRFKIAGKVAYPIDSLIAWLQCRVQTA